MGTRATDAFVKTLITLVVLHVLFLILGLLIGKEIGWFGLPMIWAHWHTGMRIAVSVVALALLYSGIYAFCSDSLEELS